MSDPASPAPPAVSDQARLLLIAAAAVLFILFGLAVDGPGASIRGLGAIMTVRDTLITDYIGVGGIGGAFLNAGTVTLIAALLYHLSGAKIGGAAIASLSLVLGFALFGKNLLNVWFIVAGVWIYARLKGDPFSAHINTAFFGAALAPIFTEILFSSALTPAVALPLAVVTSLAAGFILVPAAAQLFKAHMGFSLYNMGFTAGIVGTLIVAVYKSYGFVPDPVFIWSRGNNLLLGIALYVLLAAMAAAGLAIDRGAIARLPAIWRQSGQSPSDFTESAGLGATLVNMATTGAIATSYVLLVGGDINGPTIGAILTVVGFSAYGKHAANIVPVMAGVFLGSLFKPFGVSDPSIVLAALFGTTLAPIAGRFGWHWGIIAGVVHSSAALSVGFLHGGLNLYNNGFAAGIVAAVIAPVAIALTQKAAGTEEPEK